MLYLIIFFIVLLLLINWWAYRMAARRRVHQRDAIRTQPAMSSRRPAVTLLGAAPATADCVAPAVEPVTRAFPLRGLSPGRVGAAKLEQLLRRLRGVTTVYVSPVTALVYLAYLPAQVTEQQLVQAMRRDGYQVARTAQRFDWRHAKA